MLNLCQMLYSPERKPSLGVIQPTLPDERSFFAPNFEVRTLEDTLAKEWWARREAWEWAKDVCKLKGSLDQNRATFFSPSHMWCLHAPSSSTPEETEFVVDSGASMRKLSRKDF